jgi:hypothetical protein
MVEYVCDGCGKRAPAINNGHNWLKPASWFQRSDADGPLDACSRACVEVIARSPKGIIRRSVAADRVPREGVDVREMQL